MSNDDERVKAANQQKISEQDGAQRTVRGTNWGAGCDWVRGQQRDP